MRSRADRDAGVQVLHLTVRVAWHDRAWDGAVCDHPARNAFCLALDRVRESRDDAYEESVAGRHWADLHDDALPPCRQEAAAFMSAREWTRVIHIPTRRAEDPGDPWAHAPDPGQSAAVRDFRSPFAWMTRRDQEEIENRLPGPASRGPRAAVPHGVGFRPPASGSVAGDVL